MLSREDVYKTNVVTGIEDVKHERHGVVDPVEHYAWHDAIGAIVHPAKEQADKECMNHLRRIEVGQRE